jgi:hypothetical protein
MKGRVSAKLERVLQDKGAREQLREALMSGKGGRVTVDGTTYKVNTEVRTTKPR